MTKQKNLKELARQRAATTGESYAEARRKVVADSPQEQTKPKKNPYPATICALDIETSETDFKEKAKSKISIVGVKLYNFESKKKLYTPGEYKCFRINEMSELSEFLRHFPGIIIGHNIFDFDFIVLRSHFSLEGIVDKTVDTLAFLCRKNDNVVTGLGLDNLCLTNFGKGKTIQGNKVSEMWRKGKQEEVIRYNENDCDLTQKLWWELVSEKKIYKVATEDGLEDPIEVKPKDLPELTGEKPRFTYDDWEEKAAKGETLVKVFFHKRSPFVFFPDFEAEDFFGKEFSHVISYCGACDKTMLFENTIIRGCGEFEKITCPGCKGELGTTRCDDGMPELLGIVDGNHGNGISQGMVPTAFEEVLRRRAEKSIRRLEREQTLQKQPKEERCGLCKMPPHEHYDLYENPVDGSPICIECMTACRWILSVK